jgi:phosphate transport system substrate-binding protein
MHIDPKGIGEIMLRRFASSLSIALAALALAGALVACSGGDASTDDAAGAPMGATNSAQAPDEASGSTAGDGASDVPKATGRISVVAREDGSGTRSAFVELFGVEDEVDGKKADATTLDASITNSTAVMLTTIAGDPRAIGYISLGSLDPAVKALDIDGTPATTENVKNGSYKIQRPFNLVTTGELSPVAQDFMDFILSTEGQAVVEANHYVAVVDTASSWKAAAGASGSVKVAGSSSVTPVMEKLKEAYEALNPDAHLEIQQSDSSTGIQSALDGICDIGMASRALKDTESAAGLSATVIALDGIATIVNNDNPLSGLASEQVRDIYLGIVTDWEALDA